MGKRGPKSQNEMSVAKPLVDLSLRRPSPPAALTEYETSTWVRIVGSLAPDWFRPSQYDLLEQYCCHVATAAVLSAEISRWNPTWLREDDGLKRYRDLLAARARETQAMVTLARSMRMTHQSVDKKVAATKAFNDALIGDGPKPWDPVVQKGENDDI